MGGLLNVSAVKCVCGPAAESGGGLDPPLVMCPRICSLRLRLLPAGAGYQAAHLGAPALFRRMLATLRVNDWGLFGGGS